MLGCAPKAYRLHPDFNKRYSDFKCAGLLPPDIKVYELSAGSVREQQDEWCAMGQKNCAAALQSCSRNMHLSIKEIEATPELQEEIDSILPLYRAVSNSIAVHAYEGPFRFPDKEEHFLYSIGDIGSITGQFDVDGLLLINGSDEISTGGRKALMVVGFMAGMFTGVYMGPRGAITAMNAALVDQDGSILWYKKYAAGSSYDMRDPKSMQSLVDDIMKDFPGDR